MKMKFFKLAEKLSSKSDYDAHKLGAVIVRKGNIIGLGFNRKRTHPRSKTRFQNIHAELSAILNSSEEDLTGCSIYIFRKTKLGDLGTARPCEHCMNLIKSVGIEMCYYSTETGYKEEIVA